MGRFLFTWELGNGFSHLINIRSAAQPLATAGHQVWVAARDVGKARAIVPEAHILPAPYEDELKAIVDPPLTFADILLNVGFAQREKLAPRVGQWCDLFDQCQPDVILIEHSPTALLAAQLWPARKALFGNGFCCPRDESPLAKLRPWQVGDPAQMLDTEQLLLDNLNAVLNQFADSQLQRVSELFGWVDRNFLLTLPELDHFGRDPGATYYGVPISQSGPTPRWPAATGQRVFAYFKKFPAAPALLRHLNDQDHSVVACLDGVHPDTVAALNLPNIRFEFELLDLTAVARECDLAITNGNHVTGATLLMAGKPLLLVPLFLEQVLGALAIERTGAGISVSFADSTRAVAALDALLTNERYTQSAQAFAARNACFQNPTRWRSMLDEIERLALPRSS